VVRPRSWNKVLEQAVHVDAQSLVVAVDPGPGGRWAAVPRGADSGQQRRDDLVADGEQGGDGAGTCSGHLQVRVFIGTAGCALQRTEPPTTQDAILRALAVAPPARFLQLTTAD